MVRGMSASLTETPTGTATVNWTPAKSTPALWCDAPIHSTSARLDVIVNSDDNMTEVQFNATALPASECSDECTLDILAPG